jgi:hypothetical protein
MLNDFFRMANMHLNFLGKTKQGSFHKVLEKRKILKYFFVRLFKELCFKPFW